MAENFKFEKRDYYLYVAPEGVRRDLSSIVQGTKKIQELVSSYDARYVLADYRKVRYEVPLTEAYNIVKVYENKVPEFSTLVMAAVVHPSSIEIAQFWQSMSHKRGYAFKVFHDIEEAEHWIVKVAQGKLIL